MPLESVLNASLVAFLMIGACLAGVYTFNRSRWTLQEAKEQSGFSDQTFQELIKERLLVPRRKYLLLGPSSFDRTEVIEVRNRYPEIQEARAALAATIRQAAEEAAETIRASNEHYQEQARIQEEELERIKRVHAEILKHFRQTVLPSHVVDALRLFGLPTDASFDVIHKRYRELAKQHHPDRGGDTKQFRRIHDAYMHITAWIQSQNS